MTSVKKLLLVLGIFAVVLGGSLALVAQDQLNLHDAGLNNMFTGGSSQLNPHQINLVMETQNCPGQLCVFGLSTAMGINHLASNGNYSITTPKGAPVTGGFAGPFFLTVQPDGHSTVTQTAPITFSYSSAQGTLTGSLTFTSVSATVGCCSNMQGTFTATGGSFAQFFPNGGSVTIVLGLSFPLQLFPAVPHAQSVVEFQSGTITANAPQLVLTCASNMAQVGVPYDSFLVATGGIPPYTYSIASGSLPPGLTLNPATGEISGTPTTPGTYNYTAQAVDSVGNMVQTQCSIVVSPPGLVLTCASGMGQVNVPYDSFLTATGGTPPYTFSISSGSLPPGLTLNPSTGEISGTPTTPGTFNYTAKVTDSLGMMATTPCSITIQPPGLTLTCASGTATVGVPYDSFLVATGGIPPYTFAIASGSLPPGLTLNPATGEISGTPTMAGTFNYVAQVTDSTGAFVQTPCSIVVSPPPLTLTCSSGTAQVGVPYDSFLVATGGVPPYTFSIVAGSLPPGLTLNPSTGEISGTPTQPGTFTFTAKVTDSTGAMLTTQCSIVVQPPPLTLTCPSGTGQVGVPYSSQLTATGGIPPYIFSIVSGSLPPGLTLNPSTGAITGTPTQAGTFNFTAKVTDSTGAMVQTQCSIVISPPPLTLTCSSGTAQVGVPYDSFLVATGGVPPYTFSIVSGSLPPGLTLNPSTGEISGTPTMAGTFNFTAKVTDSTGAMVTAQCSIVVSQPANPSLAITKTADTGGTPSNVAAAGQPIGFTVTVYSTGPADATNVTMTDPLPNPNGISSGINWSIDATTGNPTCSIVGSAPNQTLNCSKALLPVGSNFTVHVNSPTTAASAAVYNNCATASANGVSAVQACASITVVGTCTLGYPFGSPPSLTSVVFNESIDLVAAAACNASGCGEPVAGPNDWVALFYTDEHAMTLGVRQIAVKTASGTVTTNYPITPLTSNPGEANNPLVGTTMLGDNLFFPNNTNHNPMGFPNDQAGTDTATWNSTYFYLDSSRPVWPALFITDITSNLTANNGDYQQGGLSAIPPTKIFGTWKGAMRTVDKTHTPYAITVTPDSDPAQNQWNLGPGSDVPPGGFNQYPSQGWGTEDRWDINQVMLNGQPLTPGHAYRMQIMVHDGDQNQSGGDVGEACLNVVVPGTPGLTLTCPAGTAFVNAPYDSQLIAMGGVPPYLFSITGGSLPPGLSLNSSTGVISGTPITTGTFNFTAQVTDSASPPNVATVACGITVTTPPPLSLTKSASPTTVSPFQLVTWTYTVTNNGLSTLTNIVVTDDNGTPGDPSDDFTVGTIASLGPGSQATLTYTGYPPYQTVVVSGGSVIPGGSLTIENIINGGCTPNLTCNLKFGFNQSLGLNDNSYGSNSSPGWGTHGHKFSDLTGSDKAEFQLFDSTGTKDLDFTMDYISQAARPATNCPDYDFTTYGSGYGTLGWCGGDGSLTSGDSTKIVGEETTLTYDLNQSSSFYQYTVNSPPAGFPGWNFVDGFSFIINPALFGSHGFGSVKVPLVHNSPSKNGTDVVCNSITSSVSTNTATATTTSGGGAQATATSTVNINSTIPTCTAGPAPPPGPGVR